jgi:ribose-phosphate pyrophosphokinase
MALKRGKLMLLACDSGKPFAEKVLKHLKVIAEQEFEDEQIKLIQSKEVHFANTEIKIELQESIRGSDVYIFQDVANTETGYTVDENFSALKSAIESAWRSDARHITAVIPSYPYARQDKSDTREGVTAARVARELEDTNANSVITLDVHNTAIAGFFRKSRFENLHSSKNIINYIKENITSDFSNLVVSPCDAGGAKLASHYATEMCTGMIFMYKERNYCKINSESIERIKVLGNVHDKDVLVVDDMVDTAGSLTSVVQALKEQGARKIYFASSLCFFNYPALERINKLYKDGLLNAFIGTDAVYHGDKFNERNPWYKEVSIAKYFARVIFNINHFSSISRLLK